MKHNACEIRDAIFAAVTGSCGKGIYLALENGLDAFAYFGRLPIGTRLLCSIRREATDYDLTLVSVDAVLRDAPMAA